VTALAAPTGRGALRYVLILGALAAFAPLSFDMYLPAFPELVRDLDASASLVQLSLTSCLLGVAVGQLVFGAASDSLGRRRPLLAGLAAYALASLACAAAPTVEALVALRLLQGFAAGAAVVASRAVVRDIHSGVEAARFFSLMMLVNGLAPILAPAFGSGVLELTSWRGVFVVLAATGVLLLGATGLGLPETNPPEQRRSSALGETLRGFAELLRHRGFVAYALALGLAIGGMFAYIAGSPFALQELHGLSPAGFALAFGVNAVGIMASGQANRALLRRFTQRALLRAGQVAILAGATMTVAAVVLEAGLAPLLVGLFVAVAPVGFVLPNATALALADHPHLAGTASALLGVAQFVVAAAVTPLVGVAGADSAVPMALAFLLLAIGGRAAIVLLSPRPPAPIP
jgi:DHA1 family bicyclomycin/chloramphenicol resistance-like MFS transporter